METIKETIKITDENIKSHLKEGDIFFDIETLGLSKKRDPIYLIGLAEVTGDRSRAELTLFFANHSSEEQELLSAFQKFICRAAGYERRIITFNGNTFDIPYIIERGNKYGIGLDLDRFISLDLLKEARSLKSLLLLPGCKQKDIENFLGIDREDKFSGGELISVYKDYELRPDDEAKDTLIQHNRDDVAGLIELLPILSYKELKNAIFNIKEADFESSKELVVKGTINVTLPQPLRLSGRQHYFLIKGNELTAVFILKDGKFRYEYTDYKNYVYLPEEDIAVPKALAASIPKERKAKATRDNCHSYVPADPGVLTDEVLTKYIESLIRVSI